MDVTGKCLILVARSDVTKVHVTTLVTPPNFMLIIYYVHLMDAFI